MLLVYVISIVLSFAFSVTYMVLKENDRDSFVYKGFSETRKTVALFVVFGILSIIPILNIGVLIGELISIVDL